MRAERKRKKKKSRSQQSNVPSASRLSTYSDGRQRTGRWTNASRSRSSPVGQNNGRPEKFWNTAAAAATGNGDRWMAGHLQHVDPAGPIPKRISDFTMAAIIIGHQQSHGLANTNGPPLRSFSFIFFFLSLSLSFSYIVSVFFPFCPDSYLLTDRFRLPAFQSSSSLLLLLLLLERFHYRVWMAFTGFSLCTRLCTHSCTGFYRAIWLFVPRLLATGFSSAFYRLYWVFTEFLWALLGYKGSFVRR